MNACPSWRRRSIERLAVAVIDARHDPLGDPVRGDAVLLERVAVTDRDSRILRRLSVNGDTVRSSDLILATVASADRAGLVVEHRESSAQIVRALRGELRH